MILYAYYDNEKIMGDILDLPPSVYEQIATVQEAFFKWLFHKENNHNYWVTKNGQKTICSYDATVFVEWLNECYLPKDIALAKVVKVNVETVVPLEPYIVF